VFEKSGRTFSLISQVSYILQANNFSRLCSRLWVVVLGIRIRKLRRAFSLLEPAHKILFRSFSLQHPLPKSVNVKIFPLVRSSFLKLSKPWGMFTFLTCRKLLYAITIYLNSKKKKHNTFGLLMVSLEFFIDIILPIALWPWCRLRF